MLSLSYNHLVINLSFSADPPLVAKRMGVFASLVFFAVFQISVHAQTLTDYENQVNISLNKYDAKNWAVHPKVLDENIATAFSALVFGNSDVTTNTSAFGYVQNKDKTAITANANLPLSNTKVNTSFLRLGATAQGSSTIFDFYSDDSWKNGFSFNIGYIRKLGRSSQFFTTHPDTLGQHRARRRLHMYKPLHNAELYNLSIYYQIRSLKDSITALGSQKSAKDFMIHISGLDLVALYKVLPKIKELLEKGERAKAYDMLVSTEDKIYPYICIPRPGEELRAFVEDTVLYKYDKQHDITGGYSIWWLDINVNVGKGTYKFAEENIDSLAQKFVKEGSDASLEDVNRFKLEPSITLNFSRNNNSGVLFAQFGTLLSYGSFLESDLVEGTPSVTLQEGELLLRDEKGNELGSYNMANRSLATGALTAYLGSFFNKQQTFGLNVSLRHNYLVNKPDNTFFKNNFSLLFGPIFRVRQKDKTTLSFGIDIGWDNAIYNTKISDDVVGRIRVGVPFNVYDKKK